MHGRPRDLPWPGQVSPRRFGQLRMERDQRRLEDTCQPELGGVVRRDSVTRGQRIWRLDIGAGEFDALLDVFQESALDQWLRQACAVLLRRNAFTGCRARPG